jgi:hypothetical protein
MESSRDDMTGNVQFENDLPDRRPTSAPRNVPAWIAGVAIVVAIIGLFAYGSANRATDAGFDTAPIHDTSQALPPRPPEPPPVHP